MYNSKDDITDQHKIAEEWRYLMKDEVDEFSPEEATVMFSRSPSQSIAQPPPLQQSSSTTSFGSRFRRPLKKENSVSSITSLSPSNSNTTDQSPKPTRRKLRNKFHRRGRKSKAEGYAKFYSDVMGITFLEIESANDLPPERNVTRTGFDMDPFVIITYGVSTFRTRAIRHNLNPVWNEKLYFHVRNSQENYKLKFAVYDRDKFSGNDFIASQEITISDIIQKMPKDTSHLTPPSAEGENSPSEEIERNMGRHTIPLKLAKPEKWKDSIHPTLNIRAKFVPYVEIRKMFWVALAKTCDADNSNTMSRLEVQTMLEALGSNISESTLDRFWTENGKQSTEDLTMDELAKSLETFMLTTDESLDHKDVNATTEADSDAKDISTINPFFLAATDDEEEEDDDMDDAFDEYDDISDGSYFTSNGEYDEDEIDSMNLGSTTTTAPGSRDEADYEALAEADGIQYIDGRLKELQLQDDEDDYGTHRHKHSQEKVIRLNECPICHKPNLSKRGQMDIVTHVATCAANDWTTVDRFLMSNIGSEAQAQRK